MKMVAWTLAALEIKELVVALDTTHAFKSENSKWGIKIHIAGISPFGIPIALKLMEDGKSHDMTTFEEMMDMILSYGIPVKFVIGDGAYDDATFYYVAAIEADAEGIARYNPRRSEFKNAPRESSIIEFLKKKLEEYESAKRMDKQRRGPKRKKPLSKGIVLSEHRVQGEMLRNFPLTPWSSEERTEIYKNRTLVERINSILKLWLGLEDLKTHSEEARVFNIYSSFISLLLVSMLSIELGVPEAMLRISIWNL